MNTSSTHPLDNPIWNALTTHQQGLATINGKATSFPVSIGPLTGLKSPTRDALNDLSDLKKDGTLSILFLEDKLNNLENQWTLVREGPLTQMVLEHPLPAPPPLEDQILSLEDTDIPEMLVLTKLTQPGPFAERTIDLGGYIGIKKHGRLVAMAGQRLHVPGVNGGPGYREISAVCTHPDHQGKGYAKALMIAVAHGMMARGETPFLHAWADNHGAIAVYEKLGFRRRRFFELSAIRWSPQKNPLSLQ